MAMTEKRRSQRKLVTLHAYISRDMLRPFDPATSVETLNLSRRGALIESATPLMAEEVCTFKLTTNDNRTADIQGRVVWVEKIAENTHRAGVAFRNLTADEEYLLDLQLARSGK